MGNSYLQKRGFNILQECDIRVRHNSRNMICIAPQFLNMSKIFLISDCQGGRGAMRWTADPLYPGSNPGPGSFPQL